VGYVVLGYVLDTTIILMCTVGTLPSGADRYMCTVGTLPSCYCCWLLGLRFVEASVYRCVNTVSCVKTSCMSYVKTWSCVTFGLKRIVKT
jgi:hypothetical protein